MTNDIHELLVISDMDGTLLGSDMQLSRANLETIRLFVMNGGHFTVGTGRIPESVNHYPELVGLLDPAIVCGGCILHDFKTGTDLLGETMPRAVAKNAMQDILQAFPEVGAIVFAEGAIPFLCVASKETQILFEDEKITYLSRPVDDLPRDWNKVLFAAPYAKLVEIEEFVSERSYPGIYFLHTSSIFFEMMPLDVNKGTALEKLCAHTGFAQENVVVIGDYYNDLDIMRRAGFAVAMANAPDEVKMLADEVTGTNDESGVGQFLYSLLKRLGKV